MTGGARPCLAAGARQCVSHTKKGSVPKDFTASSRRPMIRSAQFSTQTDLLRPRLEPAGDGKMWIDPHFRNRLCQEGMGGFEQVMGKIDGQCLRELRIRENWYLPPAGTGGDNCGLYLKKHRTRSVVTVLRGLLGFGPGQTAARVEVNNVDCLSADGIAVMRVVAYGEKMCRGGLVESFLLTEELAGYTNLRRLLTTYFAPGRLADPAIRHELKALVRAVAALARRFHQLGYNHRDFYCCHFLVKRTGYARFDIRLIDLQRVQRRKLLRRRWIVKDLAQLAWSAPRESIGCKQRVAFIKHYLGVRKLTAEHKRLIRSILCKQRLMRWRLGAQP
jgi:heptose I phosphotransferase